MPASLVDAADRLTGMANQIIERAGTLKLARLGHPASLRAHIIGRATEAASTLVDASRRLLERLDRPRAEDARAWTEWLHHIASPVNAIAGWLSILHGVADESVWAHAARLVDRNVEALVRMLKQPPGRPDTVRSASAALKSARGPRPPAES